MLKYQIQNNNNKPLENTFTLKGKAVKMFSFKTWDLITSQKQILVE